MHTVKYLLILFSALFYMHSAVGHDGIPDVQPETVYNDGFKGVILDVRSGEEYAEGHIAGAINIPHQELAAHLAQLGSIETPLLVYCRSGRRAGIALETLTELGYRSLQHLDGDMLAWQSLAFPLKTSE